MPSSRQTCPPTCGGVFVLRPGAEHSDGAGVDVDEGQAAGGQGVAPHWLARRLAPLAVTPRYGGLEGGLGFQFA